MLPVPKATPKVDAEVAKVERFITFDVCANRIPVTVWYSVLIPKAEAKAPSITDPFEVIEITPLLKLAVTPEPDVFRKSSTDWRFASCVKSWLNSVPSALVIVILFVPLIPRYCNCEEVVAVDTTLYFSWLLASTV